MLYQRLWVVSVYSCVVPQKTLISGFRTGQRFVITLIRHLFIMIMNKPQQNVCKYNSVSSHFFRFIDVCSLSNLLSTPVEKVRPFYTKLLLPR